MHPTAVFIPRGDLVLLSIHLVAEFLVNVVDDLLGGLKPTAFHAFVQLLGGVSQCIYGIGQFSPEKTKRILLFAHWDTRPVADKDIKDADKPIDGANDGGSGVGVLLEMARQFSLKEPNYGVDIIFFDAEDYGTFKGRSSSMKDDWCLGSQYWGKNPPIPNYRPKYGILLDMVGEKNAQFPKEYFSTYFAKNVVDKVWNTGRRLGYSNYFISTELGYNQQITDDHRYVNILANIPSIDIISYDPNQNKFGDYHHTHADNMDIIDKNSLKAVGQTVIEVIYQEK